MDINKDALDNTVAALKNHLLRSRVPEAKPKAWTGSHPPSAGWQGKLSSSALSTATAVFALAVVDKEKYNSLIYKGLDWLRDNCNADGGWGDTTQSRSNISTTLLCWSAFAITEDGWQPSALRWVAASKAKPLGMTIAKQHLTLPPVGADAAPGAATRYNKTIAKAESWIANSTGSLKPKALADAVNQQYGKDRSFSAPILTMCALAGRLGEEEKPHVKSDSGTATPDERGAKYLALQLRPRFAGTLAGFDVWRLIKPLPFELAVCPHQLFKWLKLPVVSYALPALIAVGQANYYHRRPKNPVIRLLRHSTRRKTLVVLRGIQPESGGFLEAIPLTAFVVMSLAASGQRDNPCFRRGKLVPAEAGIVSKGTEFLATSARDDGSWPIDTNLATWVTTLSINALAAGRDLENVLSLDERRNLQQWLLSLQYRKQHPYTHAEPGGWAWTNLSGAVPDADDTAGALIALRNLGLLDKRVIDAAIAGLQWLLGLQNRDGGIPTFCRGWSALPFDRSAPDITAHTLSAISAWLDILPNSMQKRMVKAIKSGLAYLERVQKEDGSWVPLWFGNQFAPNQENPVYGTARVLTSLCGSITGGLNPAINCVTEPPVKLGAKYLAPCFTRGSRFTRGCAPMINKGVRWLLSAQNQDGGWGGAKSIRSSIEETALAVDALAGFAMSRPSSVFLRPTSHEGRVTRDVESAISRGVSWLIEQAEQGTSVTASPIGLYFARLWYFEELYPVIFTLSALQKVQNLYRVK